MAAWRAHATAAHIEEESGNLESAHSHRNVSRATILQLVNSMPEEEPLRSTFLSSSAVARVLSHDAPPRPSVAVAQTAGREPTQPSPR